MHSKLELGIGLEVYQEFESTFTHDGKEYELNPILAKAEKLPVKSLPVSLLKWVTQYGEADPKRVAKADLNVPVLVVIWQGKYTVIDGFHRLTRAIQEGLHQIPAKLVPTSWLT